MTEHAKPNRRWLSITVLVAAVLMLAVGAARTHKVYEAGTAEAFGLQTFIKLSDRQLVIDSTFSGVEQKNGKLYSTYDRAASGGKRACPT